MTEFTGNLVDLSRTVSHALRHEPEVYGIQLDANGWTDVERLLAEIGSRKAALAGATEKQLRNILATSAKTRFEIRDGRVRARYGHSFDGRIAHPPLERPPATLYHGTASGNVDSILAKGLLPCGRQYVHLSGDLELAARVGERHGSPVVFLVDTEAARASGVAFFVVDDDIYLAESVPPHALTLAAASPAA